MNVPETFFSVHEELILFGFSVLSGAVIGVAYDAIRAVRLLFPHNTLLTSLEDLIFLCGCGLFFMIFSSSAARGVFRMYYIIGGTVGFVLYFFTVGSVVVNTIRKLVRIITSVMSFIFRPLGKFFALISKKAKVKFVGCSKKIVIKIKKIKMLLLKHDLLMYNSKENIKRKNVKNVARKKSQKTKRNRSV